MSQNYLPQQPPGWTPQPQHAGPPVPPKKAKRWPWVAGIVASLFVGYGVGAAGDSPETTAVANPVPAVTVTKEVPRTVVQDRPVPGPAVTVTVTAKPVAPKAEPKPAEPAPVSFPGDGTYVVGEDIKPGRYKSRPAEGGMGSCYWSRLRDLDGGIDSIIDNGLSEGQQTVTIKKSDEAFETNGCQDWVLVK